MNYEEKYKEALERARIEYKNEQLKGNIWVCENLSKIFPELRESEDERNKKIKKEVINMINYYHSKLPCFVPPQFSLEETLAWLEKQGEKKSIDMIEPKFKVGDWVVDKHHLKTYQVFSIDNSEHNYIVYSCKPLFNTNGDWPCFHEDMIQPWTIQDANDGDILEFGDHGRLVVGIVSHVNKTTGKVDVNCLLENNNFKIGNYYNLDTIKPHPATKEQHDLLFQKMHEAGYEWDAEKKELKKIEEASTWSEEDKKYIAHIIAVLEGWDREHVSLIPSVVPKCINWLKSLKPNIH